MYNGKMRINVILNIFSMQYASKLSNVMYSCDVLRCLKVCHSCSGHNVFMPKILSIENLGDFTIVVINKGSFLTIPQYSSTSR